MKDKKEQRKKFSLFKKIQRLDRKIGEIDRNYGVLLNCYKDNIPSHIKLIKIERDNLDQKRAIARMKRINYGRATTN